MTAWCRARLEPGQALAWGLLSMRVAFVPLLAATPCPYRTKDWGAGCSPPSRRSDQAWAAGDRYAVVWHSASEVMIFSASVMRSRWVRWETTQTRRV